MHDNEGLCLESLYDKALDDGPRLLDDKNYNAIESGFNPTIFEMDRNYVLVDHEKGGIFARVGAYVCFCCT